MGHVEYRRLSWAPGYEIGADGSVWSWHLGASRRLKTTPEGYRIVVLAIGGRQVTRGVHRLVCEAFHGPPPFPRAEARHRDGNPANNVPENLAWGTKLENEQDKRGHGRVPVGSRHGSARLTEPQVADIRSRTASGVPQRRLAIEFGVSTTTIWRIVHRHHWQHVEAQA